MKNFFNKLGILGWLLIATTALAAGIGGSIFVIGTDSLTGDVEIHMRDGRIKWNDTDNVLQFSNDAGTQFKDIGAGAGAGGAGGINLLLNPSFEDVGAPIADWTNTGGTFTQNPHGNSREGNEQFARFVATGAAEFFESALVTIADDIGPGCMADFKYKQGDNAFVYKVLDQVNTLIVSGTISDLTDFLKAPTVTFPCAPGDQFKLRIESTGAGTIDTDEAYLGSNKGFVDGESRNSYYLEVGSTGSLVVESRSGITPSKLATGYYKLDYASLGLTNKMACVASITQIASFGNVADCEADVAGTSTESFVRCHNDGGTGVAVDKDFTVTCSKTGSDANQAQEAFSPEQADFFIQVEIGGGTPTVPSAGVLTEITNATLDMVLKKGSAKIPCSTTNPATGLTCSAGNESVGIVFNAPVVGKYKVCSNYITNGAGFVYVKFVETQNSAQTILQEGEQIHGYDYSSTNGLVDICNYLDISSVGEKTFRLMNEGTTAVPTLVLDRVAANRSMRITVELVSHSVSRPIVQNMVDTSRGAGLRVNSCKVNLIGGTPSSLSSSCDSWVSGYVDGGLGLPTINIITGVYSSEPECQIQIVERSDTAILTAMIPSASTSSIDVRIKNTTGLADYNFNIICIGAR